MKDGVPFREAHERVAASVRDGTYTTAATAAESVAATGGGRAGSARDRQARAASKRLSDRQSLRAGV